MAATPDTNRVPAPDCIVIGGGLAGSMAAMRLAQAGRNILLLERETGPHHKVCGEFLSAEAVAYLRSAGIDPVALGAARIHRLRVSTGRSVAETGLPFAALSLSRRALDEVLLDRAAAAGAVVRRGSRAESLTSTPTGWSVGLDDHSVVEAPVVFLATGKHDLRDWRRPDHATGLRPAPQSGLQPDLVGFKMHFRLAPAQTAALQGFMDLFLFRGGYGGLALIEDGLANLCLVVRARSLKTQAGWPALLASITAENSLLGARLTAAEPLWPRPLAISSIPYGYLAPPQPGLWRLGDQAAVIPSFTGDGMSIALHSGAVAAQAYLCGSSAEDYQRALARTLRPGVRLATLLSRAVVHPAGRALAPALLRALPQTMRWIAAATRVPEAALLSR